MHSVRNHRRRIAGALTAASTAAVAALSLFAGAAQAAPVGTSYPASGAVLRVVSASAVYAAGAATNCPALRLSGMTVQRCGTASMPIGTVIWSLQRATSGRRSMVVFERVATNFWRPRLRANEAFVGAWSDAKAVAGDPDSDGRMELLFGFRHAGTGGYLDLDIVDIRLSHVTVTGHVDGLAKGRARLSPGRVLIAEGLYGPSDPNCCPSRIDWNRLAWNPTGGWRAASRAITLSTAPPLWTSQF